MQTTRLLTILALLLADAAPLRAQEAPTPRTLVQEGNRLLLDGKPKDALDQYAKAAEAAPDSAEVAFNKGLALLALGQYEDARTALGEAEYQPDETLSAEARLGLGMTYHAEAVQKMGNPSESVELLKNAMDMYQTVLRDQPDHPVAGEANRKAVLLWRHLLDEMKKQQEQRQQQQQNQDQNQQQQDQQQNDQQQNQDQQRQQEQSQDQRQQQNQEQQSQSQQDAQKQDQQQSQDQQQPEDQAQRQQQEQKQGEQQQNEEQQPAAQQTAKVDQEQQSRDEAERRLRAIIDRQRQRKQGRQEPHGVIRVVPVEKDW